MAAPETKPITEAQFQSGKVIPDVVDKLADQVLDLRVSYKELEIANGVKLWVAQTQQAPHVTFPDRDFGSHLYTLIMLDPDAPSPQEPTFKHFLHWVVTNIPGTTAPTQKITEHGKEVISYMGPAPPKGEHRYVFLVYRQPGTVSFQPPKERKSFNLKAVTEKYNLGLPVAGVYFVSKHGE